ncbi:MAG: electron transport complex subunit RsxC [Pontibacterium sp.]
MSVVYSFHGGIHPPENKRQSNGAAIQPAPLPAELVINLSQHIGAPAKPVVEVGERVLKGQLIAEAAGYISVNLHAPSSGTIASIENRPIAHASGMDAPCIVIATDGQDEWIERKPFDDYHNVQKTELVQFIRSMGIAGMGGAGFPTDVKLHLRQEQNIDTLILNAAECEPYITADDMLLRERSAGVVRGVEIIAHLVSPKQILVGIEDNKPQAIHELELAARESDLDIKVVSVPTKYPSGGEKQLIKLLTGIEVPSGRIPADIGIVCQNVGTAYAIHRAVEFGEPLISRVITITGDAVVHRHNLEVLVGTSFKDLLDASDVQRNRMHRLIMGGPMMGFAMHREDIPVVKSTNCIIAATEDEMPPAPPAQPCIRCGMCEQVCPAELLPQQLHWFAQGKEYEKAKAHNLFDCIECGACSYVCPSSIPLVQYYRNAKAEIRHEEEEQRKADHARQRFEARKARLEQEKIEKAERRKARAAEAAKAQSQRKAAPAAAADVNSLKTAAAVARTKLRKAEKAYEAAHQSGEGDLAALKAALDEATLKSQQAAEKLEKAQSAPAAEPVQDTKALKTAAAVARTKLKKAQTALKVAKEKGQDGIDELEKTVAELEAKSAQAQAKLEAASAPPAPAKADPKALKTALAVARTKLKQSQKALEKAAEDAENRAELEANITACEQKLAAAQKAFDEVNAPSAAATPGVSAEQLAELKEAMEKAQAKAEKAQKAADAAKDKGLPTAEKMAEGAQKLRDKFAAAKAEYEAAQAPAAPTQPGVSPEALAELKEAMEKALQKVEKADAAAKNAEEKGLPAAAKMREGVEKLRGKFEAAKAEFEAAQNTTSAPAAASVSAEVLAELREDMEKAAKKVEKAEIAAKNAQEKGLPAAAKMLEGVEKLKGKYEDAKRAFEEASQPASAPAPSVNPEALAELEADMQTMAAKVKKAQAAADAAVEKGLPAADKMVAGVDKLKAKLADAEQAYVEAGGKLEQSSATPEQAPVNS